MTSQGTSKGFRESSTLRRSPPRSSAQRRWKRFDSRDAVLDLAAVALIPSPRHLIIQNTKARPCARPGAGPQGPELRRPPEQLYTSFTDALVLVEERLWFASSSFLIGSPGHAAELGSDWLWSWRRDLSVRYCQHEPPIRSATSSNFFGHIARSASSSNCYHCLPLPKPRDRLGRQAASPRSRRCRRTCLRLLGRGAHL